MPCTKVAKALATARPYLKFSGTTDEAVTVSGGQVVTFLADSGAELTRGTGTGAIVTVRDDGTALQVYDLQISDAPNNASGIGIAIPTASGSPTVRLTRTTLNNNPGGGVSASGGTVQIVQSTISGNAGGGVSCSGGALTIAQSTVATNDGGGVSVAGAGATFDIRNNFIYRNGDQDTGTFGGLNLGIALATGNHLEFNTIVDNRAAVNSGGVVCNVPTFAAPNNIIVRNSLGGSETAANAQTDGACTYPTSSIASDATGLAFAHPDGSPFDYHLTSGSSAIDTGTTATDTTIDVDGDARPQGPADDRGADEFKP
ncbi:MAG TPA: right-handed parallel beta-helix repeat-containing protein [Kofleriaceae bacterium]|jgi:hypothetical protein